MTQKIALETLGFGPCYHMSTTLLADASLIPLWQAALEGKADWGTIFRGYEATVDYPGAFHYRELTEVYPDAKVLLSVRDGHAWARSMRDTVWDISYGDTIAHHLMAAHAKINPAIGQFSRLMDGMYEKSGLFGAHPEVFDEDAVARQMERHIREVRAAVSPDRLLEWSPADGWEPLCAFLDVPVPEAPLPHVNDSGSFNEVAIDWSLRALTDWRSAQRATA
ncbi:MAG: sulfotransferase family protein [Streptosporangiales bacterium]|nr:sulfotransferase family protein [Streptosporangiales bacterium]